MVGRWDARGGGDGDGGGAGVLHRPWNERKKEKRVTVSFIGRNISGGKKGHDLRFRSLHGLLIRIHSGVRAANSCSSRLYRTRQKFDSHVAWTLL